MTRPSRAVLNRRPSAMVAPSFARSTRPVMVPLLRAAGLGPGRMYPRTEPPPVPAPEPIRSPNSRSPHPPFALYLEHARLTGLRTDMTPEGKAEHLVNICPKFGLRGTRGWHHGPGKVIHVVAWNERSALVILRDGTVLYTLWDAEKKRPIDPQPIRPLKTEGKANKPETPGRPDKPEKERPEPKGRR